ncbi:hypothetical protein GLYMA_09G208600v4 [Glycine max]|uniref:Uncharacterized protein n=2 Tax=Glycine subgen. Soja TaxID=1462606 RepID=A0A0R0IB75_SOYBN|nr:uncharacterized protein LOC102663637 [Glycine max]KRH39600.1 hypothetical protein GLYMA_09G208600v4 [Glycine max]RZB93089.1 hypothetical protein D0Y65_024806 [Glycine soja]|eukprot:XP_006587611.1 uncharacterized protein LOC102663637 [Glycine max]
MMSILSFTCYDAEGISVTHNSSHVTYFAPRLNSDWPQRMQVLSLDKDRRLVPISMNSSGDGRETQSKFQLSLLGMCFSSSWGGLNPYTILVRLITMHKEISIYNYNA